MQLIKAASRAGQSMAHPIPSKILANIKAVGFEISA
jgi:hypothetical protein